LGILYSNLGQLYYIRNEIKKSKEMFQKAISIFNKLNTIWGYISIAYSYMALINFYEKDYEKSNHFLDNAEKVLDDHLKRYWKGILFRAKSEIINELDSKDNILDFYSTIKLDKYDEYINEAYNIFRDVGTSYEMKHIKNLT